MTTDPLLFLAESRRRELQAEAQHSALVRLATCCSPSRLRAVVRAARLRWQSTADVACCS